MLRLAFRNLFQNPTRLLISIGGVGLALLLILALDAVMTGVETQVTAFIDHSQADIWVAQENVRNMHMASSVLPAFTVNRVKNTAGVESTGPIFFVTSMIELGSERSPAYVIGLPREAKSGAPWQLFEGKRVPEPGEIIVDRRVGLRNGVGIGDKVKVFGEWFRVVGLSEGTATIAGSVVFIAEKDWKRLEQNGESVSFVLATVKAGESPEEVARRIEAGAGKVTAQTRQQFAAQERQVVRDMSTDLITIMNLVGLMIGLAVMALTVYTATLSRRAEYGVLKALGARNRDLYRAVLGQSFISVGLGLALGLAFTLLLVAIIPRTSLPLTMELGGYSLVKTSVMSLFIASLAAILPVLQIAGLDPVLVFRRK